jgi:hypothetical protein
MDGVINDAAIRSFKEVAAIMRARGHDMTSRSAWHTERRALRKLRQQLFPLVCDEIPDSALERQLRFSAKALPNGPRVNHGRHY